MDRFRVPGLLVNTSPLTEILSAGSGSGRDPSAGMRLLAESLSRPGFGMRPLQNQRRLWNLFWRASGSIRRNSVVLAEGGSCFKGLAERVKAEIEQSLDAPSQGGESKSSPPATTSESEEDML